MFSKAKKPNEGDALMEVDDMPAPAPASGTTRKANAKPAPRAKAPRPAGVPSIISADVMIKGTIESEGEVQFDGEIEGDLKAKGLVIGESAKVHGEVVADKVRVCGTVEGAIRATRVELAAGSLVKGDIIHTALAIEAGARFEGNVKHAEDPQSQQSLSRLDRPAPSAPPASSRPAPQAEALPREEAPVSQTPAPEKENRALRESAPSLPQYVPRKPAKMDLR